MQSDISKIESLESDAVYAIIVRDRMTDAMRDRIVSTWHEAWRPAGRTPPVVIVLDSTIADIRRIDAGALASVSHAGGAAPAGWDTLENVR